MSSHPLSAKFFANYDNYMEVISTQYSPSYRLQLAEQIIPAGEMKKLVTWMDHNAHVAGSTVYFMELNPIEGKPHPANKEMRVFIALGVFDRKVDPALPYWCHIRNHFPVSLGVDLIITDLQGNPVTHAVMTAFQAFDRQRTYEISNGYRNNGPNHHSIHTGIIDRSSKVIFEAYPGINHATKVGIRLLAERQILQKDTELAAVWLLAGLKAGVCWKVEDHVDIVKAVDTLHPRNSTGFKGYDYGSVT